MVKKLQQNLRETIQKALKQPLRHVDFQNYFGGAYPRTQISSAEKNTHKKYRNYCLPLPFKISRYATGFAA